MSWLASSVHVAFGGIFRAERYATGEAAREDVKTTNRALVEKYFADIDKLLTGKTFAMGGQYTVCDPYLLVFYRWGNRIGIPMKERFPVWAKHSQRVASRPTVKRVLEAEGIQIDS